jgi:hypothetical protein
MYKCIIQTCIVDVLKSYVTCIYNILKYINHTHTHTHIYIFEYIQVVFYIYVELIKVILQVYARFIIIITMIFLGHYQ